MKQIILVILSLSSLSALGQIKASGLSGNWTACNKDSLYYNSDKVVMYQDANYYIDAKCCDYVTWKISSRKNVIIKNSNTCSEPGTVSVSNIQESFKLVTTDEKHMIILKRGKEVIDKFIILELEERRVERYPFDIKLLTLQRVR